MLDITNKYQLIMIKEIIHSIIGDVLKNSYISIDEKGDIKIHPDHTKFSKEDMETFYWIWCQLDNGQQLDAIRDRFSGRRSLRFI